MNERIENNGVGQCLVKMRYVNKLKFALGYTQLTEGIGTHTHENITNATIRHWILLKKRFMHYAPICLPNCKINRINLFERANSVQFRMFFLSVRRQSHTKSAVCYLLRGRFYWLVWLGNSAEAHSSRYDTQNENEPRKKNTQQKNTFHVFCRLLWLLLYCLNSHMF